MNKLEIKSMYKELNLEKLKYFGLGRNSLEYYLFGLFPPLRYQRKPLRPITIENTNFKIENELNMYIHFPFCNSKCTFCHFYKNIIPRGMHNDIEDEYIDAIIEEINLYKRAYSATAIKSIQFGGGTPSLMSIKSLKKISDFLANNFQLADDHEIKFEFHPEVIDDPDWEEKLRILMDMGLTALVIDIESIHEKILKHIGRGATSYEKYVKLIEKAKQLGVREVSCAIMSGLPYETLESFQDTINTLSSCILVDTINLYPLMLKPGDYTYEEYEKHPERFATREDQDLMEIYSRLKFKEMGYTEGPIHFFKKRKTKSVQQLQKTKSSVLVPVGTASFGYSESFSGQTSQSMNYCDIDKYIKAVKNKQFPIWRISHLNEKEKELRTFLFQLSSLEFTELSSSLACELHNEIHLFKELGLIEMKDNKIKYTLKGILRNSEIVYYLSPKKFRDFAFDDDEIFDVSRYEYFPRISLSNQFLFLEKLKYRNKDIVHV